MVTHAATLTIGRLILGIGAGIMNVVFGKYVSETIPQHMVSRFTSSLNFSVCFGFIACFALGYLLPDADDLEANKEDELWRVIWLGPTFVGIIEILLILVVFRNEPIAFCLTEGRDEEALVGLSYVYRKRNPDDTDSIEEILESHYELLKKSTTLDASTTSFKQAAFGPKYWKATWVCFMINFFN